MGTRDTSQHPTVQKMSPNTKKDYPDQHINDVKSEKLEIETL